MRSAPAVDLGIALTWVWRWGVAAVAALSVSSVVGWWFSAGSPVAGWRGWARAGLLLAVLAVVLLALRSRPLTGRLHWDGQRWFVRIAAADPQPCHIQVALDAGPWMLLRCALVEPDGRRGAVHWLDLQRRAVGPGAWHGLRCALYNGEQHQES